MKHSTRPSSMSMKLACAMGAALLVAACASSVQVRTQTAPGVQLPSLSTFRVLPTPTPRGGMTLTSDDPMLANSITNRALREDIRLAFEQRGYRTAPNPDFEVAYYASANKVLNVQTWDYGYTWRGWPREYVTVNPYEQGTVIIDVVNPATHQLLWRGQGQAAVSTDPNKFMQELGKTVQAIVKKFPPAHNV